MACCALLPASQGSKHCRFRRTALISWALLPVLIPRRLLSVCIRCRRHGKVTGMAAGRRSRAPHGMHGTAEYMRVHRMQTLLGIAWGHGTNCRGVQDHGSTDCRLGIVLHEVHNYECVNVSALRCYAITHA
jgi:hypothetical protein